MAGSLNRYPDREFTALREDLAAYLSATSGVPVDPGPGVGRQRLQRGAAAPAAGLRRPGTHGAGVHPGVLDAPDHHPHGRHRLGRRPARRAGRGVFDLDAERGGRAGRASTARTWSSCAHRTTRPARPSALDVVRAAYEAAPDAIVVVDEAYAEFARPGTPSALTLLEGRERLVVTRTMSKAFALAGGRLGYLAATPELVDALRLVRMPYHLSAPTQAVARAALAHAGALLATVEAIKGQRDRIVAELRAMGLEPVPSDANFVLFGGLEDEHATWRALLDEGVLVRDVGLADYLRVTAGTPAETDAFLAAMADLHPPTGRSSPHDRAGHRRRRAGHRTPPSAARRPRQRRVELDLDGTGAVRHQHRGAVLRPHARRAGQARLVDLHGQGHGDVDVDAHHTVEDVAIVLGEAFREALGDKRGISPVRRRHRAAGRGAGAGRRRRRRPPLRRARGRARGPGVRRHRRHVHRLADPARARVASRTTPGSRCTCGCWPAATRTTSSRPSSRRSPARCAPRWRRDPRVEGIPSAKGSL